MVHLTCKHLVLLLHIFAIFKVQAYCPPRCSCPSISPCHKAPPCPCLSGHPWDPTPALTYQTQQEISPDFIRVFGDQFEAPLNQLKNVYLAGFDHEIYKLKEDITKESVKKEIRVTFYLWTHHGFKYVTTLYTDYETLGRNINKYHHYFQLKKVYSERFTKKKEWCIDKLIMLPSTFSDDIVLSKYGHAGELTAVVEDPSTAVLPEECAKDHQENQPCYESEPQDEETDVLLDIYKEITGRKDERNNKEEISVNNDMTGTEQYSVYDYKGSTKDTNAQKRIYYQPEKLKTSDSTGTSGSFVEYDGRTVQNNAIVPTKYAVTSYMEENISPGSVSEYTTQINRYLRKKGPGPGSNYVNVLNEANMTPKVVDTTADTFSYSNFKTDSGSSFSKDKYSKINQESNFDKSIITKNYGTQNDINIYNYQLNSGANTKANSIKNISRIRPYYYFETQSGSNVSVNHYDLVEPNEKLRTELIGPIDYIQIKKQNPVEYNLIQAKCNPINQIEYTQPIGKPTNYGPIQENPLKFWEIQSKFNPTSANKIEHGRTIEKPCFKIPAKDSLISINQLEFSQYINKAIDYSQIQKANPTRYWEIQAQYNPPVVKQIKYDQYDGKSINYPEVQANHPSTEDIIEYRQIQTEKLEDYSQIPKKGHFTAEKTINYETQHNFPTEFSEIKPHLGSKYSPKQAKNINKFIQVTSEKPADDSIDNLTQYNKNQVRNPVAFGQTKSLAHIKYDQIQSGRATGCTSQILKHKPMKYRYILSQKPQECSLIQTQQSKEHNDIQGQNPIDYNYIELQKTTEFNQIKLQSPIAYSHIQKLNLIDDSGMQSQNPIECNTIQNRKPTVHHYIDGQNQLLNNRAQTQNSTEIKSQKPEEYSQIQMLSTIDNPKIQSQNPIEYNEIRTQTLIEQSFYQTQKPIQYSHTRNQNPIELGHIQKFFPVDNARVPRYTVEYTQIPTRTPSEHSHIRTQLPLEYKFHSQTPIEYNRNQKYEPKGYSQFHTLSPTEHTQIQTQTLVENIGIPTETPIEKRPFQRSLYYRRNPTQKSTKDSHIRSKNPIEYHIILTHKPIKYKTPQNFKPIESSHIEKLSPVGHTYIQRPKPLDCNILQTQKSTEDSNLYIQIQNPIKYHTIQTQKPIKYETIQKENPIEYSYIQKISPIQKSYIQSKQYIDYSQIQSKLPIKYSHKRTQKPIEYIPIQTKSLNKYHHTRNPIEYYSQSQTQKMSHIKADYYEKPKKYTGIQTVQPETHSRFGTKIPKEFSSSQVGLIGHGSIQVNKPLGWSGNKAGQVFEYKELPLSPTEYDRLDKKHSGYNQIQPKVSENLVNYRHPFEVLETYSPLAKKPVIIENSQPSLKQAYCQIEGNPIVYSQAQIKTPENLTQYNQALEEPTEIEKISEKPIEHNENKRQKPIQYQQIIENPIENNLRVQIGTNPMGSQQSCQRAGNFIKYYDPRIKKGKSIIECEQGSDNLIETEDNKIRTMKTVANNPIDFYQRQIVNTQGTENLAKYSEITQKPFQLNKVIENPVEYRQVLQNPIEFNQVIEKPNKYIQQIEKPIKYTLPDVETITSQSASKPTEVIGLPIQIKEKSIEYMKPTKNLLVCNKPAVKPIELIQLINQPIKYTQVTKTPNEHNMQEAMKLVDYNKVFENPIENSQITTKPFKNSQITKKTIAYIEMADTLMRYYQPTEKQLIDKLITYSQITKTPIESGQETVRLDANNKQAKNPIKYSLPTSKTFENSQLVEEFIKTQEQPEIPMILDQSGENMVQNNQLKEQPIRFYQKSKTTVENMQEASRLESNNKVVEDPVEHSLFLQNPTGQPTTNPNVQTSYAAEKSIEHRLPTVKPKENYRITIKPVEYSQLSKTLIEYSNVSNKPTNKPIDYTQTVEQQINYQPIVTPDEYGQVIENLFNYRQPAVEPSRNIQPVEQATNVKNGRQVEKSIQYSQQVEKPIKYVYDEYVQPVIKPVDSKLAKKNTKYIQALEKPSEYNPQVENPIEDSQVITKLVEHSQQEKTPIENSNVSENAIKHSQPSAKSIIPAMKTIEHNQVMGNPSYYGQKVENPIKNMPQMTKSIEYGQPALKLLKYNMPVTNLVKYEYSPDELPNGQFINTDDNTQLVAKPVVYSKLIVKPVYDRITTKPIKYSEITHNTLKHKQIIENLIKYIPGTDTREEQYNHKANDLLENIRSQIPLMFDKAQSIGATKPTQYSQIAEKPIEYRENPIQHNIEALKPKEYGKPVNTNKYNEDQFISANQQTQNVKVNDEDISWTDNIRQFEKNANKNIPFPPNDMPSNDKIDILKTVYSLPAEKKTSDFNKIPYSNVPITYTGKGRRYGTAPTYLPEKRKNVISNNDLAKKYYLPIPNKIENIHSSSASLGYMPNAVVNNYIGDFNTRPYTKSNLPMRFKSVLNHKPTALTTYPYSENSTTEATKPKLFSFPKENLVLTGNTLDHKYNYYRHQEDSDKIWGPKSMSFIKPTANLFTNICQHHPRKNSFYENIFGPNKQNEVFNNINSVLTQMPVTDNQYKPIVDEIGYTQPTHNMSPLSITPSAESVFQNQITKGDEPNRNIFTHVLPTYAKLSSTNRIKAVRPKIKCLSDNIPYTNIFGFGYPNNNLGNVNNNVNLVKEKHEKHEFHSPIMNNDEVPVTMNQYHQICKPEKQIAIQQIHSVNSGPRKCKNKYYNIPLSNIDLNNDVSSINYKAKLDPEIIPTINEVEPKINIKRTSVKTNPSFVDQSNTLPLTTYPILNLLNTKMPVICKASNPIQYESVTQDKPIVSSPQFSSYSPQKTNGNVICGSHSQNPYSFSLIPNYPISTSVISKSGTITDSTPPQINGNEKLPDSYSQAPFDEASFSDPITSDLPNPNSEILTNDLKTSIKNWLKRNPSNIKSIPIGEFGLATFDKDNKFDILKTDDPNIVIKTWAGKVKVVKAKLIIETEEVSVINFLPEIIKGDYDPKAVQYIVKKEIKKKYGEPIVIEETSYHEPYVLVNNGDMLKSGRFTILWPTFDRRLNCWAT